MCVCLCIRERERERERESIHTWSLCCAKIWERKCWINSCGYQSCPKRKINKSSQAPVSALARIAVMLIPAFTAVSGSNSMYGDVVMSMLRFPIALRRNHVLWNWTFTLYVEQHCCSLDHRKWWTSYSLILVMTAMGMWAVLISIVPLQSLPLTFRWGK